MKLPNLEVYLTSLRTKNISLNVNLTEKINQTENAVCRT